MNALYPGFIPHTGIWRDVPWYVRVAVGLLARLPGPLAPAFVETPATGAETVVYLAERLWAESERLTGVEWGDR